MALVTAWERPFRTWHYAVSYHQLLLLLLRSLSGDSPTRVDVLFSNVYFLHMPAKCERLEIHATEEFNAPGVEIPTGTPGKWFVINDGIGYIYATHCQWHEDEGNAMTESRFGPFKRTN